MIQYLQSIESNVKICKNKAEAQPREKNVPDLVFCIRNGSKGQK
jgi:hypothetical protein